MQVPNPNKPIEVRCFHCDVSFPAGARQCLHCGNRLGRPVIDHDVAQILGEPVEIEQEEEAIQEMPGRRVLRGGFTAFWVLIALVSAAVRSCQG